MKQKINRLARRYATALRTHLSPGAGANLVPALGLGRAAVGLGLETLELARMHERAVATLDFPKIKNGLTKRAQIFFAEANTPIEENRRAARPGRVHLGRLEETLSQRTEELAATNRQLQRGVVRRKVMEDAFEKKRAAPQEMSGRIARTAKVPAAVDAPDSRGAGG